MDNNIERIVVDNKNGTLVCSCCGDTVLISRSYYGELCITCVMKDEFERRKIYIKRWKK